MKEIGIAEDEENFDEAVRAAFHVWTRPTVPSEVQALMMSEEAEPNSHSSDFWVLVAALKAFVAKVGDGGGPPASLWVGYPAIVPTIAA